MKHVLKLRKKFGQFKKLSLSRETVRRLSPDISHDLRTSVVIDEDNRFPSLGILVDKTTDSLLQTTGDDETKVEWPILVLRFSWRGKHRWKCFYQTGQFLNGTQHAVVKTCHRNNWYWSSHDRDLVRCCRQNQASNVAKIIMISFRSRFVRKPNVSPCVFFRKKLK